MIDKIKLYLGNAIQTFVVLYHVHNSQNRILKLSD